MVTPLLFTEFKSTKPQTHAKRTANNSCLETNCLNRWFWEVTQTSFHQLNLNSFKALSAITVFAKEHEGVHTAQFHVQN